MRIGIDEAGMKRVANLAKVAQEEGGYNGWTNYETWVVALWMDNDQGSHEYWREVVEEMRVEVGEGGWQDEITDSAGITDDMHLKYELGNRIKDQHEEMADETGIQESGVFADLMNAALSEVNWHEIAGNLLEAEY